MRILHLPLLLLVGLIAVETGCQNPLGRTANYAGNDSFSTHLAFSSDDPSGLESGRGHLGSLASELADRRHETKEQASEASRRSDSAIRRLLKRGHDADVHGRPQQARIYYEQVLAEDPDHPEAHHRLGILADQAGDFRSAERHYHKALEEKPRDADVLNDLGYSHFLQGRAAESEKYLSRALQIRPDHPHVRENLSLLYDRKKAETVLMSLMGPRQTQATLARLFQNSPPGAGTTPGPAEPSSEITSRHATAMESAEDKSPQSLEELRRKMEEARLRSLATRNRHNTSRRATPRRRTTGGPPASSHNLPPLPPRGREAGLGIRPGQIDDTDRNDYSQEATNYDSERDADRSSKVPTDDDQRMRALFMQPNQEDGLTPSAQHAARPQWNAPPENWPERPSQDSQNRVHHRAIQHARHTEPERLPTAESRSQSSRRSPADRAAEIGMAAGPGAMFPQWHAEQEESATGLSRLPEEPSMPGTNSHRNGTMHSEPRESQTPPAWRPLPAQEQAGGQSHGDVDSPGNQPASFGPSGNARRTVPSKNRDAVDSYDPMRSAQNARVNRDQQHHSPRPNLMRKDHRAGQEIPGNDEADNQPRPAYTSEQDKSQPTDQPAANFDAPEIVPGPSRNSSLPRSPRDFPAESASPNESRRW